MKEFKTKQRELILDIINHAQTPITASEICSLLKESNINLTTIYRNLDKFVADGIVVKTHINKSDYYYCSEMHEHVIVCTECNSMQNIPCHLDKTIHKELEKIDFEVTSHDLIVYGTCKDCKTNKKRS